MVVIVIVDEVVVVVGGDCVSQLPFIALYILYKCENHYIFAKFEANVPTLVSK